MEKKIDKKEGIVKGKNSLSIPVSGFPMDLWEIWNRQCKKQYQSIRWVKIWSDHLKSQAYDLLVKSEFQVIEKQVVQEEEEPKENEEQGLGLLNPEIGGK